MTCDGPGPDSGPPPPGRNDRPTTGPHPPLFSYFLGLTKKKDPNSRSPRASQHLGPRPTQCRHINLPKPPPPSTILRPGLRTLIRRQRRHPAPIQWCWMISLSTSCLDTATELPPPPRTGSRSLGAFFGTTTRQPIWTPFPPKVLTIHLTPYTADPTIPQGSPPPPTTPGPCLPPLPFAAPPPIRLPPTNFRPSGSQQLPPPGTGDHGIPPPPLMHQCSPFALSPQPLGLVSPPPFLKKKTNQKKKPACGGALF